MRDIKGFICEKIQETAKKAVKYSVGKSFWVYGYENKIPEEVKKWVIER